MATVREREEFTKRTCHRLRYFVFANKCSKKWKKVLTNICLLGIIITNERSKLNKIFLKRKNSYIRKGTLLCYNEKAEFWGREREDL